jgi:hypothetical protein
LTCRPGARERDPNVNFSRRLEKVVVMRAWGG